jgi:hypothetical protein
MQLPVRPTSAEQAAEYAPAAEGEEDEPGLESVVVIRVGECSRARECDGEAKCKEKT